MIDVLIAGAGPAGSVAAVILARAGVRVQLVDRARFPRDKLCGDTLNPGALARLRALDLSGPIESLGLRVEGMIVSGDNGVTVRGRYAGGAHGRALRRCDLDRFLLDAAVSAGARVEEGVVVRAPIVEDCDGAASVCGLIMERHGGAPSESRARVTLAADGRRSTIALSLGLLRHPRRPRRWAIGGHFEGVDGLTGFGEMHIRRNRYLGVAPLPGGLANACLVSSDTRGFDAPAHRLEEALRSEPILAPRFARARLVGSPTILGPLAVDAARAGAPGLLLAGDAAGFVDPMTGDGLRFAIRGAELAARAALDMLAHGHRDGYIRLAEARRREFAGKQRFNRALRALVASEHAVAIASRAARVAPALIRQLIRIAGDA